MRAAVRLEVALKPSRLLLRLAALAYALTLGLIILLLPDLRGAMLAVPVFLLGLLQWRHRFQVNSPVFITGICHDGAGWALRLGVGGTWQQARLLEPVFVHRHLVVLRFRRCGRRLPESAAIAPDSCDADDFRRLRVLARHLPAPQLWAASR